MATIEEIDSGMASVANSSKELTPEKAIKPMLEESDDEDIDETLAERLWGLTEMFPESVRNATHASCSATCTGLKGLYSVLRFSAWAFFSTAAILIAPVIFETERIQVEEMQKQQQRQILLGPSAAIAAGGGSNMNMPGMPR